MVVSPKLGDVLLRGTPDTGFVLVDAVTLQHVAGPLPSLPAAVEAAQRHGAPAIWQQAVDNRGRPLGELFRLRPVGV